jgi:hypothetical protein
MAGACQPESMPSTHVDASSVHVRWQKRLAESAERSHPPRAFGGLAAATTLTRCGSGRSPTTRSRMTRSRPLAALVAVDISSRNNMP